MAPTRSEPNGRTPNGRELVLASGSAVRTRLLTNAGVAHEVVPADVDEGAVRDRLLAGDTAHGQIAEILAELKAQAVSLARPGAIVLGADQTLSCDGLLFGKPAGPDGARDHLRRLSGKAHTLHTAVCAICDGEVLWHHNARAVLHMRTLTHGFIEDYVTLVGAAACQSVGAYQLEGPGVHLFSRIEGDFFDILGLPLLPVLAFLRDEGVVPG